MDLFSESKDNNAQLLDFTQNSSILPNISPKGPVPQRKMIFQDSTNVQRSQNLMFGNQFESLSPKKKPSLMINNSHIDQTPDGTFSTVALEMKRHHHHTDSKYLANSVISPRVQHMLDSIKDPMLKIKRSIERFGRDLIDVA